MSDSDQPSSQLGASSSGRAQRVRRPAKRFGETVSWQEASQRVPSGSRATCRAREDTDDDEESGESKEDEDEYEENVSEGFSSNGDEDGLSEEMSDSEDEYHPEDDPEDVIPKKRAREPQKSGDDSISQSSAALEGDDGLYGSSDDGVSFDEDANLEAEEDDDEDDRDDGRDGALFRTQGNRWAGTRDVERGGAYGTAEEEEEEEADGDEDVPADRLRELVDAYAANEQDADQGDRWTSAMMGGRATDAEEEIDDEEFMDDVRGAMGFRRGRNRTGQPRRARQPRQVVLSEEVSKLVAEGSNAFILGDIDTAKEKFQEVIRIDPHVRSAWANLASFHEQEGRLDQALHCRIIEATLTSNAAAMWLELAEKSADLGYNRQAGICLGNAVEASRKSKRHDTWDLLWRYANFLRDAGDIRAAARVFRRMLAIDPTNNEVVKTLVGIYYGLRLLDKAVELLEKTRQHNLTKFDIPCRDDAPYMLLNHSPNPSPTWDLELASTLVDLYLQTDRPAEALTAIRQDVRWMQNRAHEAFWDQLDDDREYDEAREEREEQYGRHIEQADVYELPGALRLYLGVARSRLGDYDEAWRHLSRWIEDKLPPVDEEDEEEEPQALDLDIAEGGLFVDEALAIAERYGSEPGASKTKQKEVLEAAKRMGEQLTRSGLEQNQEEYAANAARYGNCLSYLGHLDEAIEWLNEALHAEPNNIPFLMRLAELYEEAGDTEGAVSFIDRAMRQRRENMAASQRSQAEPLSEPSSQFTATQNSFFVDYDRAQTTTTPATERERRKEQEERLVLEAVARYKRLDVFRAAVFAPGWWSHDYKMAGNPGNLVFGISETVEERTRRFASVRQWLVEGEKLATMFCNTPQLYPSDRSKKFKGVIRTHRRRGDNLETQAEAMLARLSKAGDPERINVESSDFRGIRLDEWTTLIVEYALVLTKLGEYQNAKQILAQVTQSSIIYGSWKRRKVINLCTLACALYSFKNLEAVDVTKVFMNEYQFHAEPLRVAMTLVNSMGSVASAGILSEQKSAKLYLRRERFYERVARGHDVRFNASTRRWVDLRKKTDDDDDQSDDERRGGRANKAGANENNEDEDSDGDGGGGSRGEGSTATEIWPTIKNGRGVDEIKHKPPTKHNPSNAVFYAGVLLSSSSGIPSMAYWLRAFAHQPNDPLICLTAAVACLGRATNRQVDNRNHVVLQAYALMQKYRELRQSQAMAAREDAARADDVEPAVEPTISGSRQTRRNGRANGTARKSQQGPDDAPIDVPEVDYNFGRVAHHMALYSLAVPHYQAVLRAWDKAQDGASLASHDDLLGAQVIDDTVPGFDAVGEAAYNLHLIFLSMGNTSMANHVMERYLTV